MYKIVSFRYESVIQNFFARLAKFFAPPPPQSQIRSYGLEIGLATCIILIFDKRTKLISNKNPFTNKV